MSLKSTFFPLQMASHLLQQHFMNNPSFFHEPIFICSSTLGYKNLPATSACPLHLRPQFNKTGIYRKYIVLKSRCDQSTESHKWCHNQLIRKYTVSIEKYFYGQVRLGNTVQIISLLYSTIWEWITSPGIKKTLELHLVQVLKKLTSSRESFHHETIFLWKEMKILCNNV